MGTHTKLRAFAAAAALLLAVAGPLTSAAAAPPVTATIGTPGAEPAPLLRTADPIPGQYIVTLSEDVTPDTAIERAVPGVEPLFTYDSALNGFAAKLTPEQLTAVRALPGVTAVEEDGHATAEPVRAPGPLAQAYSWGLDRIDQFYLPLNQQYNVNHTGAGARVFVIDSGIDYGHPEFGGRAVFGFDAIGDGRHGADCAGHGTHVAGTIGGANFGVARHALLVSVRVLGCDNRGSWSGIIAGFDWVADNARQPAVVNASLGGDFNQAVNDAVDNLAARGVLPVVAAGNETRDACQVSPASATWALTVGATDHNDRQTGFSNYGPCLEIFAPGQAIMSARLGGGSVALDGTSMASPHVAGVAALYKSAHPTAGPSEVANWLIGQSTKNVLAVSANSPNRLLYTGGF
ncbi:S8 family peptidase [Streptomyces litchfieldiae]|uniref:S8 family peptidase n=1 Tax=Streptomyces litchfieldiae TaxID=3075543 RepID=A0ABU2MSL1_9ACTN|nr:S8 family peptidase [Streptomyces sp. DSM 44938]MDT0344615.1 S8 family peptidase [Streptomyces sp. DSM 44938]